LRELNKMSAATFLGSKILILLRCALSKRGRLKLWRGQTEDPARKAEY